MDGDWKIFSLFTEVEDKNCAKFVEYYDRLVQNKQDYADKIGVEFKMIKATASTYQEIQHEKFRLLDELAPCMYVDLDVVFNTDENIFEHHEGLCLFSDDYSKRLPKLTEDINRRSWYYKHYLASALHMYDLGMFEGEVPNTGIMISDKPIGFYKAIPDLKAKVDEMNEEGLWPIKFDYNNEGLLAYYTQEWNKMDDDWNHIHRSGQPFDPNKKVYHMISKEFELCL